MTTELPRFEITVWLNGEDKPRDVTAINPDMIRYELEAKRYGMPADGREVPMTWITFLAWAALVRNKAYEGEWIKFRLEDCLSAAFADEDDEVPTVGPTQPDPESGSS